MIPHCVGARTRSYAAMEGVCPPPQGPSLRSGLCCPVLHRLMPHPPHSRAHRDFTAKRLIRDAFAVRERRGDPRVVPCFHYHSFLACRPLRPRGARSSLRPVPRCRHMGLRRELSGSALPNAPQSVSRGSWFSWLYGSHLLQPAKLLAPRYGSDRIAPRSTGAFTSTLSTGRSPFPLLDMTTTASLDSFCRRDLHPQE